ncbi:hypothetical protein J4477_01390 [Candidatus Pacearchaeota archaeon]|nr:hypothetical protein [Candidatus Pacearchaeota archaeon]
MSYEIRLVYDDKFVEVPPHNYGGTVVFNGTQKAELNITSNYSPFFREHLGKDGIFWLSGKKAEDTTERLEHVVSALSNFTPSEDYWKPTAGNVGKTLSILLEWARHCPYASWEVLN